MNNQPVVKVENLTKTFNKQEVIKPCNMSVNKNSIYGFLGPNGAGKTTIFKMLIGLLSPTTGRIEVLGMNGNKQREMLRNIGSMIETPVFYEHLPAETNLDIHLSYMGVKDGDISSALEEVGLNHVGNQPVSQFSFGMRQRLGIARAIVHKPKLLVLDEPINGLDPMGIRDMRNLFPSLVNRYDMTILLSSHILNEMEHVADTIGIITNGTIVEEVNLKLIQREHPEGLENYFFNALQKGANT
ncbi:ATP-binding cassette domain-containing protein [Gracilibacillus salitolerans]|uniref:ATP-binding cassette domain-containing protein n=1 Tax=Gracilibacillus salitolerans TaxID=2663022 RepID=A0A5Q2TDQ7_9BACI|nr:ATP-binding cassette domain-containing protein [Gracilibacillus salitolerans]QGH32869.1 ATP-binding cassette domain-containing protein [Gracilibacillus salitolerans]